MTDDLTAQVREILWDMDEFRADTLAPWIAACMRAVRAKRDEQWMAACRAAGIKLTGDLVRAAKSLTPEETAAGLAALRGTP